MWYAKIFLTCVRSNFPRYLGPLFKLDSGFRFQDSIALIVQAVGGGIASSATTLQGTVTAVPENLDVALFFLAAPNREFPVQGLLGGGSPCLDNTPSCSTHPPCNRLGIYPRFFSFPIVVSLKYCSDLEDDSAISSGEPYSAYGGLIKHNPNLVRKTSLRYMRYNAEQ